MKCANCGRDNPAGARYCIHCGAEHSVPTPIAAAAAMASRARGGIPQAANAAHADPVPEDRPEATEQRMPETIARSTGHPTIVPHPTSAGANTAKNSAALPAYAASPRRSAIALSLVVACFFIAVAGFFAWRMFAPEVGMLTVAETGTASRTSDGPGTSSNPSSSAAPIADAVRKEAADPARSDVTASTAPLTADAMPASKSQPTDAPQSVVSDHPVQPDVHADLTPSSTTPPVEITPLPAKPAAKVARKTPPAQQPTQHAAAVASADTAAPAPSSAQASPPPVVVAAAPKASKAPDQWTKLREELDACTREDFIARVVCGQRVRFKYCSGSWGKVPECPGSPQAERGQ